jgi:hypothetical protein
VTVPAGGRGYYTVTIQSIDRAGNLSSSVTRLLLSDTEDPSVFNVVVPTTALTGGQDATFTAVASDNVDLRWSDFALVFTNGSSETIPLQARQSIGAFGLPLNSQHNLSATVPFVRALMNSTGADAPSGSWLTASHGSFRVWDAANEGVHLAAHTGQASTSLIPSTVPAPAGTAAEVFGNLATFLNNTPAATGAPSVTTLRVIATGPTGTFNNPFTRVVIYRVVAAPISHVWFGEAGAPTLNDTGAGRTWTYTGPQISAAQMGTGSHEFVAVGYTANGHALRSQVFSVSLPNPTPP